MDVLYEVLKFLGYSAIGFLAGYQLCKIRRNTEEIKEAVVSEQENTSDRDGSGTKDVKSTFTGHGQGSGWQGRALGVFVLLLAIFTAIQGVYVSNETRDNTEHDKRVVACQAQFNKDFSRAVTVRGQYADEDRAAMYRMITTVISGTTPAIRQKAITDWIELSQKNDELRKANPLPSLEARNCGEVN